MTAARRLAIATRGFRGGGGGTVTTVIFEPELVKLEDPFTVKLEDENKSQLPADVVISLDDLPLTVSQLGDFSVTKGDDLEVKKEH